MIQCKHWLVMRVHEGPVKELYADAKAKVSPRVGWLHAAGSRTPLTNHYDQSGFWGCPNLACDWTIDDPIASGGTPRRSHGHRMTPRKTARGTAYWGCSDPTLFAEAAIEPFLGPGSNPRRPQMDASRKPRSSTGTPRSIVRAGWIIRPRASDRHPLSIASDVPSQGAARGMENDSAVSGQGRWLQALMSEIAR